MANKNDGEITLPLVFKGALKGVHETEQILVRKKNSGREVLIRPADFDEDQHERAAAPKRERVRLDEGDAPALSKHTDLELTSLTIKELKGLPEWKRVKDKGKANDKGQIIDAILKVRQRLTA